MRTSVNPACAAAFTYSSTTDGMSSGAKAWRSISRSIGIRCIARHHARTNAEHAGRPRRITREHSAAQAGAAAKTRCLDCRATANGLALPVLRCHDGLDPAAHREVADHGHAAGGEETDEVVEDLVR